MMRGSLLKRYPGRARLSMNIRQAVGYCPFCEHHIGRAWEPAPIYRSSRRSLTFRCAECSLQWTMTVHRLASAVRRAHERAKERGDKNERWLAGLLEDLEAWDSALAERRGRRPSTEPVTV